eukprot:m.45316 g.45316  ORF g.45316 m.45316 type:complete len:55 (-) comp10230_c0_seq1:1085-1249(-)
MQQLTSNFKSPTHVDIQVQHLGHTCHPAEVDGECHKVFSANQDSQEEAYFALLK